MSEQEQEQPNLFQTLFGMIKGILDTGIGFSQTAFGFIIIRLFYSIPVFLVWWFMISPIFILPRLSYVEVWAILVAFDCFRFDITRHYK